MPHADKKLIRAAVIETYRQSLSLDGIELLRVKRAGSLNAKSLRRIANAYLVNRGIRKAEDDIKLDANGDALAAHIMENIKTWPPDLNARAERCAEIARWAHKTRVMKNYKTIASGELASAITKLVWFIIPDNWTLFDRFAADGLCIPKKKSSQRMVLFYAELERRGFTGDQKEITKALKSAGFKSLYGGRVIDKFLMLAGAGPDWRDNLIADCELFLETIPADLSHTLKKTANEIATTHSRTLLRPSEDR